MPIEPARLSFTEDGTPRSEAYGDIYHSREGGLEQAHHVFLAGNGLPERWQSRAQFTIVETGFGLGLNFLATWDAWRRDAARCTRLNYVSVELHPFTRADLGFLHARWPGLAPLAEELQAKWPPLTPGFHRLHLDEGRVVLTLLFGDARALLPQLVCRADAFYLDGFSPAANPELWSDGLLQVLPQLASTGATLATWSVSGALRRALAAAGFQCEKAPGFRGKREMLRANFTAEADPTQFLPPTDRRALVIGAGLAGSSIANRLAAQGWLVDVVEAAPGPAAGASGNLAGVLRPLPSLDDNRLARITRAGTLYALRHLRQLGDEVRWDDCGVLHLARDPVHEEKQRKVVEAHQPPAAYLRFVERDEASRLSGWPLPIGGWWFPGAAWVNPPSLCAANLDAFPSLIRCHYARQIQSLERVGEEWVARDASGTLIAAAPVAILANGVGIRSFPQAVGLPVRSARGQVTHLLAGPASAPKVVVCRLGYVSPAIEGIRCAGATFSVDDEAGELRESDHRENLAKLDFILPGFAVSQTLASPSGRVGFRPTSPDRLPMIGALPSASTVPRGTPLSSIPRHRNLFTVEGFGARGLVWAALSGELLASQLTGAPLPLERELVDSMDPARFLARPHNRPITEE